MVCYLDGVNGVVLDGVIMAYVCINGMVLDGGTDMVLNSIT